MKQHDFSRSKAHLLLQGLGPVLVVGLMVRVPMRQSVSPALALGLVGIGLLALTFMGKIVLDAATAFDERGFKRPFRDAVSWHSVRAVSANSQMLFLQTEVESVVRLHSIPLRQFSDVER